jgi:MEKHLA domain
MPEPSEENSFWPAHAALLLESYRHWTGRDLLISATPAQALYHAPFGVLSHDTAADPCFTYANLAAQTQFEMSWSEIVGLPSRLSAEPLAQAERESLLARVASQGYIDDYSGVRIARSGKRFTIQNATVWNLVNLSGVVLGQAACFEAE